MIIMINILMQMMMMMMVIIILIMIVVIIQIQTIVQKRRLLVDTADMHHGSDEFMELLHFIKGFSFIKDFTS